MTSDEVLGKIASRLRHIEQSSTANIRKLFPYWHEPTEQWFIVKDNGDIEYFENFKRAMEAI